MSLTPLVGAENPELHSSDFSRVIPRKMEIQTSNVVMTPSIAPSAGVAALTSRVRITPSRNGPSFGVTPKGTPIRDELHINDDMDMSAKLEL